MNVTLISQRSWIVMNVSHDKMTDLFVLNNKFIHLLLLFKYPLFNCIKLIFDLLFLSLESFWISFGFLWRNLVCEIHCSISFMNESNSIPVLCNHSKSMKHVECIIDPSLHVLKIKVHLESSAFFKYFFCNLELRLLTLVPFDSSCSFAFS